MAYRGFHNGSDHKVLGVPKHNKLVIPFLWSVGSIFVLPYLLAINTRIKDSDAKLKTPNKENSNKQNLQPDYLYLIMDCLGDELKVTLIQEIPELRSYKGEAELRKIIPQKTKDALDRQKAALDRRKAIRELCEALEQGRDPDGLINTIRTACDEATAECNPTREERALFDNCMYAYIRAWLVCSIQYDTLLPINSIFYQDPSRGEFYLKAINELIERFGYRPIDKFLTDESRKIVKSYLKKLVKLIEQEQKNSNSTNVETSTANPV